jgi:hypothetical protein
MDREQRRQRDESASQWRVLLKRKLPEFRALCPIPRFAALSELERFQARIIAQDVADLTLPAAIDKRRRPSIFISRLEGLAATELLFPAALPPDLFPVTKEELRALHLQMPSALQLNLGPFTFGARFSKLESPSEKFRDVTLDKQSALLKWGASKGVELFFYTFHHRGAPLAAYGRTSAYSWDGTHLHLLQKTVGEWVS